MNQPKIEERSIESLSPAEYNPRTITKARLEDLKRSIEADPDFLKVRPIIVNTYKGREGVIIGGHMRYEAAKELGMQTIPCVIVSVPKSVEKNWNVKDNAHHGKFDEKKLTEMILNSTREMAGALPGDEYDRLLNSLHSDGKSAEQQVDEIIETGKPICKVGDRWELGDHVLICGDSTKPDVLKKLLGDTKADMCFTDPPYNVAYGESAKDNIRRKSRKIENDKLSAQDWGKFVQLFIKRIYENVAGATYICMSTKEWPIVQSAFVNTGFHWSDTLLWVKSSFTIGRADYQRQYEPILKGKPQKKVLTSTKAEPMLYGWPEGSLRTWNGGRSEGDAWFFRKPSTNPIHPTMKPVELVAKAVSNSSNRGDTVLDIFAGGDQR